MKKLIYTGLAGMLAVFAITGCEKNNLAIDQEPLHTTPFAKFNVRNTADSVATLYVASTGEKLKIPIGITAVSDQDRTIQLCYTSSTGAQAGVQFTPGPASITIPAGKTFDTLELGGIYSGYPLYTRVDTVRVTICGGDLPVQDLRKTYVVVLKKFCDVDLTAYSGLYNNVMDGTYGPYSMTFTGGTVSGRTATATVTNLWDSGWPTTTTINLDWSNPAAVKVTIPDQVFYGPANWWIVGLSGGTFSSCEQIFTLKYKLYNKVTGATLYNNQTTTMKR
jgi:hypothetical protein